MDHFLSQLETYLKTSLLLSFAAAYLGGMLASLTPCVYPMIPITAGVIGNANVGGSKARGFFLSLCYVTGMALTYAGLGVFAAATGRFFGTVNTSPWTFLIIGNIMLLLGIAIAIQFVPYGHAHYNPPVVKEPHWDSPRTRELFDRACADCHSNRTRWPAYADIAPISWLVTRDVNEGREHFNVSVWGTQKRNKGKDAADEVKEGE
ncbi:MAG: hypothetical protein DSY58_08810, partial [Desulfobulbus sp.]